MRKRQDSLWLAISRVVNDGTATDKEKLGRIEAYLEVYKDQYIIKSSEDMI